MAAKKSQIICDEREAEIANAEIPPTTTLPKEDKQPVGNPGGFCVYIGPSIMGVIQAGAILEGTHKAAVASIRDAVAKYPLIATLVVPGQVLAESRMKSKTPGNLLHNNYVRLVAALKKSKEDA